MQTLSYNIFVFKREVSMTELEKLLKGMIYDPSDEELATMRRFAHKICSRYNLLEETMKNAKNYWICLFPKITAFICKDLFISITANLLLSGRIATQIFNLTVLDCANVTIGDDVFIGPNVCLATPVHPLLAAERNMFVNERGILADKEYAKPIVIKSDCWIASNVTVCGGVTIGKGTVIGAGSVVTKDIPDGVFAAGNPCKVIRKLTEADSIYSKKELWEK